MATTAPSLWRNWGYYTFWWTGILVPLGTLQFIGGGGKLNVWVVILFVGFSLTCATLFTLAQNTVNQKRRKPVSWGLAIFIWMALKFASLALFSF